MVFINNRRHREALASEQRKLELAGIFCLHAADTEREYWCRMSGLFKVKVDPKRAGLFGLEGARELYVREWYRALREQGVRPPWASAIARAFWRTYESVTVGQVSDLDEIRLWGWSRMNRALKVARRLRLGGRSRPSLRSSQGTDTSAVL